MELKSPRRKVRDHKDKIIDEKRLTHLPTPNDSYTAYFNGFSVIIRDKEQIFKLNRSGNFGKGTFSRNMPKNLQEPEILRQRQFQIRKEWASKAAKKDKPSKVLVVPDSDSDNDNYFTNLEIKYEIDTSGIKETLNLTLEEAFFLLNDLNVLELVNETNKESKSLGRENAWQIFQVIDEYFVQNYLVYYYFRVKNWVVKSGIKFGGDMLLYKYGPQYYHASYVVIIDVLNENLDRIKEKSRRNMKMMSLTALQRLCETTGKDLLICQIIWPTNIEIKHPNDIKLISIKEVLVRRFSTKLDSNVDCTF